MNPYIKQYNQYKENSVMTASPETVLIMLYSGAINFLLRAKIAIEQKNIEDCHENIIKTQRILREFMDTLDMESGGDVAQNLYRLYEYLHHQLIQANIKKDIAILDEVIEHLRGLKETWEQAIKIASHEEKSYVSPDENVDRSA